ncbi:DUF5710 domain-containing protein [Actinomadura hibisca]|uniref:DUF5710 domain-containing protein n=1 Tax=Actinomadura hibisca TaxID=68565 RepID=UPI001FE0FD9A|nr:DUF5710 domain-containing protein [Actinomadura hibisca]
MTAIMEATLVSKEGTTGMAGKRLWLDVSFSQKDQAKAHGARWDPKARRWYAPRTGMEALQPWMPLPDVPDLLPGEDRGFGDGLFVDLVPSTCWFTNVRTCVDERDWERLRRMITGRAGRRCEVCGQGEDRDARRWLEAHERWDYDQRRQVQSLRRLVCLCTDCHTVTHMGHAQITGKSAQAVAHLRHVTGMSQAEAEEHIDVAFEVWSLRSQVPWTLDLSILTDAGVTLRPPPDAAERVHEANRQLG